VYYIEFNMDYGMGMGGGGQQQMMMSSSISAVSLSVIAAGVIFVMTQGGFSLFGTPTTQAPTTQPVFVETSAPETQDLDGARLITNGIYSMRVEGSSCGSQKVVFNKADSEKWLWNLNKVDSISVNGVDDVPVYTIESFYKVTRVACEQRYLTAPDGCNSAPYLDRYRAMDLSQRWVLIRDSSDKYQIRSLLCAKNMARNQYIIQSGAENNSTPRFSPGSGTPFEMSLPAM
jgi:hypothetical protein